MNKTNSFILAGTVVLLIAAIAYLFSVNARREALLEAAYDGDAIKVRHLLESGVNIHYKDGWSSTALMYATAHGHLDIVKELIDAGAQINERSRMNQTPLMHAAARGHNHIVVYLLERGADTSLVDRDGMTAMGLAEREKHVDVINVLEGYTDMNSHP